MDILRIIKELPVAPFIKQKVQLEEIQSYLIRKANIIANPGKDEPEERKNVSIRLREFSAELRTKTESMPRFVYSFLTAIRLVKDRPKINMTCDDLIRLSNSLSEEAEIEGLRNVDILRRIGKMLSRFIV